MNDDMLKHMTGCPYCFGHGMVWAYDDGGILATDRFWDGCPKCAGTGYIAKDSAAALSSESAPMPKAEADRVSALNQKVFDLEQESERLENMGGTNPRLREIYEELHKLYALQHHVQVG